MVGLPVAQSGITWDHHVKMKNKQTGVSLPFALFTTGEVGDWKNRFTPEQLAAFDEDYEKKMKQANIPFRTEL